jgi:drug/metabolite transporter (DMT)-like permease
VRSDLAALGAILLWATLASLGELLANLPPFFITGVGLLAGSLISLVMIKGNLSRLLVPAKTFAVGIYGLFGFHAALFAALQNAPSVQANLVNYSWPLLIVVLAPVFIPGTSLRLKHVIAALVGFAGAALAISSAGNLTTDLEIGYLYALIAAIIWATYSLMTKRLPHFETAAVGGFALVSGILALIAHVIFEPAVSPTSQQWLLLLVLGFGPLGGAFYLWDYAIKHGNPQRIGLLSFLTPLLSTSLLVLVSGSELTAELLLSAVLIVGAALIGNREKRSG